MKITDSSSVAVGSTYSNTASSKYDIKIEKIQGQIHNVNVQIQIVNEDKSLSPDERRKELRKLNEELDEHQAELGRTKAARNAETMAGKNQELRNNPVEEPIKDTSIAKTIRNDGNILELSRTALLKAENS